MGSVDRVAAVNPATLPSTLPPARIDPDRQRQHEHPDEPEKQFDKLELHELAEEPEVEATSPHVLLDYEGLDLSA